MKKILIAGATGQLGHLVIHALLKKVPSEQIVAMARNMAKADDLIKQGITVRQADYDRPETLDHAVAGIDKLLLISSSEIGKRAKQHKAVITAAQKAGVQLIVYTSVLHADTSILGLAEEHRQSEAAIRSSAIPYIVLRNGWYTENYTASIAPALQHGVFLGSAKEGRISSATRQDYAEAAANVLVNSEEHIGRFYELSGDEAYTLTDLAAEVSRQTGKTLIYKDLPKTDYRAALISAGLPEPIATLLADSDESASKGALYDDGDHLRSLIERPTTSLRDAVAAALSN